MMNNAVYHNVNMDMLVESIARWHHDRNLIDGSTDQAQFVKLIEEAGELAGNISRGHDMTDDIGDMMVVLINIAERNGLSMKACLSRAYSDIKDRTGRMVDGVFVKEADL
jgi:NTP pyrophosphatase (non-canonical NTP hydrolase)